MLKEKLFDTSLYSDLPENTRFQVLHEDFTGVYIEAGSGPLEKRVNARRFYIDNNEVFDRIDETTVKRVKDTFSYETEFLAKESRAAEKFWGYMVKADIGSVALSVSPSDGTSPYKDARINIGLKTSEGSVEFYGIPTELSPTKLLFLYNRISEFSGQNSFFTSPEELREAALLINIPHQENIWDFFKEMFPLDSNAWESIKQGLPWKIKEDLREKTKEISGEMSRRIGFAKTEWQFINIGAWGERMMQDKGLELLRKSCPGATNTELLSQSNRFLSTDIFGNTREVTWTYHTGNCLHCGAKNVEVGPCNICKSCEKIL